MRAAVTQASPRTSTTSRCFVRGRSAGRGVSSPSACVPFLVGWPVAQIVLSNISKSFGDRPVLQDIDLDVAAGEFLTLVGPSGCGKSTLLRIVAGLEPQSGGSVSINGRVVDGVLASQRDLAMVFQSYALYPHLTVRDNIALPLVMRESPPNYRLPLVGRWLPGAAAERRRIDAKAEAAAAPVGLSGHLRHKPGQLSGGQRQRVALARAMVRQPLAFLMDEPLSSLDTNLRASMRAEIAELHRRLGVTVLYVTHDQSEAMTLSTRVVVLLGGRIQQVGPPREIYEDPQTLEVAAFFGEPKINRLTGRVRAGGVDVLEAGLPLFLDLPAGAEVTVGVRPEHLRLAPAVGGEGLAARVERLDYLGAESWAHLRLTDGTAAVARVGADDRSVRPGDAVRLQPDLAKLLVFDRDGARVRPVAVDTRPDLRVACS